MNKQQNNRLSDSEYSDSSESQTNSSAGSSTTSDSDQQSRSLEPARILKQNFELPKGLCENPKIFHEFFSLDTWECLPDHMQDQLKAYLPQFTGIISDPREEQHENNVTLQKLFTNQITRFNSSPLIDFQKNLEEGNYRPDISRLRANIRKSQRREQRFQECERISRLAKSLVVSREKLLRMAYDSPPDVCLRVDNQIPKLATSAAAARAKKRYFKEISSIMEDVGLEVSFSDDENYAKESSPTLTKKQKRHLNNIRCGSLSPGAEPKITSTFSQKGVSIEPLPEIGGTILFSDDHYRELIAQHKKRKIEDPEHPELETSDIKLSDVYSRTNQATGRKLLPQTKQPGSTKKSQIQQNIKTESDLLLDSTTVLTDSSTFHIPLDQAHISLDQPLLNETIPSIKYENTDMKEAMQKLAWDPNDSKLGLLEESTPLLEEPALHDAKSKKRTHSLSIFPGHSDLKNNISLVSCKVENNGNDLLTHIKEEKPVIADMQPQQNIKDRKPSLSTVPIKNERSPNDKNKSVVNFSNYIGKQIKPATLSDLEGIDMMHLPVDLDDSGNIDILGDIVDIKPELMQETHVCFLSLIRDIFCSSQDHRTTMDDLRTKVSIWITNPITALNDWFNLTDDWLTLLQSAVHFLAGEFIDQPEDFVPYIEFKPNLQIYQWIGAGRDSDQHLRPLCEYWLKRRNEMGTKPPPKNQSESIASRHKHNSSADLEDSLSSNGVAERVASPPPPRFPTAWTVRKATSEEILEFRKQERKRFENPHLSFTYRMHGYESVVGPVKGIYTQIPALTKARGHNMLTADRPNFVTILTLVRDATARLPNGEGTRADICELLKSSQYISPTATETVLQTIVSGALDRMHTEHDPCVRYDTKRKIWIYLHRNRTEEEFERMHQQFQGISKHKKQTNRKSKSKSAVTKSPTLSTKNENSNQEQNILSITPSTSPVSVPTKKKGANKALPIVSKPLNSPSALVSPAQIQTVPITVQIPQPAVLTSLSSPPLPALSSIQSPAIKHSSIPPPLINKIVQKKPFVKPELVPIKQSQDIPEQVEADSTLTEAQPAITQKQQGKQPTQKLSTLQMPSLILDKGQKFNSKVLNKSTLGLVSPTSAPIKVTTSSGVHTVHMSAANAHTLIKPALNTILTTGNQSMLTTNLIQNSTQVRKTLQKVPPLIAQSSPAGHSYVIPISLGKTQSPTMLKNVQAVVTPASNLSPKLQKTTMPALTSTNAPRMSLLQNQQGGLNISKAIIRPAVPAGKSLISPSIAAAAANNITIQQQTNQTHVSVTPSSTVQVIQTKAIQPSKFVVASATPSLSSNVKPSVVTSPQTSSPLVLQKVIAVSKATTLTTTSNPTSVTTTTSNIQAIGTITPPGTSLINPQIIQIHQAGQKTTPTVGGTPTKVQAISSTTLTPLQQQNLLQSIKQQQARVQSQQANASPQQQSLILKQQQVLQQLQKQLQNSQGQQIQITSPIKSGTSLLGTQIHLTQSTPQGTSMIVTNPTISTATSTALARTIKTSAGNIIHTGSAGNTVTAVRTVSSTNPLVGKVITNSTGQIISLESLLQKQVVTSGPTLRLAGSKPGQTSLLQLAGSPGSQITQYAVVSQGRNLISVAQPKFITTQSTTSIANITTTNVITPSTKSTGVSILSTNIISPAKTPTDIVKIGTKPIMMTQQQSPQSSSQPRIIQSTQFQPITAQQLINAKVLGLPQTATAANRVRPGTSIRMVNASNLNFAHIAGKPVIIASKAPALIQQQQQQQQQSQDQEHPSPNRTNIIWAQNAASGIGTPTSNFVIGGQTVKVQGNVLTSTSSSAFVQTTSASGSTIQQTPQTQTVMFGNQIVKLQTSQSLPIAKQTIPISIINASGSSGSNFINTIASTSQPTRTVVVGSTGQTIKVHTPAVVANTTGVNPSVTKVLSTIPSSQHSQMVLGSSNIKNVLKGTNLSTPQGQRVVLSVQGGGQILLPPNFQGNAINLKSLQGIKMIPIQQQSSITTLQAAKSTPSDSTSQAQKNQENVSTVAAETTIAPSKPPNNQS